jgi:hypothetical protein
MDRKIYKLKICLFFMAERKEQVYETLARIDSVWGRINTHPEYDCSVRTKFTNSLIEEANRHSVSMEQNGESLAMDNREKEAEVSRDNLLAARAYLARNGVTLVSLSGLGKIVDPENHPYGGFRPMDVHFGDFSPPSPANVAPAIYNLLFVLEECPDLHPVMRASLAHLGLVQTHPYRDGNGRSARLLQNFCLEERGLPPAIIHEDEATFYRQVINAALTDRYAGKSDFRNQSRGEELFHGYIATKVLDSLRSLEGELKNNRHFEVQLKGVKNDKIARSLARRLRNAIHRDRTHGARVSLEDKTSKNPRLVVDGNVGENTVVCSLDRSSKDYGFGYEIKREN